MERNKSISNKSRKSESFLSVSNKENECANTSDAVFATMMSDPIRKAMVLQLLSSEREAIEEYMRKEKVNSKFDEGNHNCSPMQKLKKKMVIESPTALLRRRALERMNKESDKSFDSASSEDLITSKVPYNFLLNDVIAFVDVKTRNEDRSVGVKAILESMGAKVLDEFTKDVTHVIFKDGSFKTYQKAKLWKKALVSIIWLDVTRTKGIRASERDYPALGTDRYDTNTSAICEKLQADYKTLIKDGLRRSTSFNSPLLKADKLLNKTTIDNKTRRRTTIFSALSKSSISTTSSSTGEILSDDVIPPSQEYIERSVIATVNTPVSRKMSNLNKSNKVDYEDRISVSNLPSSNSIESTDFGTVQINKKKRRTLYTESACIMDHPLTESKSNNRESLESNISEQFGIYVTQRKVVHTPNKKPNETELTNKSVKYNSVSKPRISSTQGSLESLRLSTDKINSDSSGNLSSLRLSSVSSKVSETSDLNNLDMSFSSVGSSNHNLCDIIEKLNISSSSSNNQMECDQENIQSEAFENSNHIIANTNTNVDNDDNDTRFIDTSSYNTDTSVKKAELISSPESTSNIENSNKRTKSSTKRKKLENFTPRRSLRIRSFCMSLTENECTNKNETSLTSVDEMHENVSNDIEESKINDISNTKLPKTTLTTIRTQKKAINISSSQDINSESSETKSQPKRRARKLYRGCHDIDSLQNISITEDKPTKMNKTTRKKKSPNASLKSTLVTPKARNLIKSNRAIQEECSNSDADEQKNLKYEFVDMEFTSSESISTPRHKKDSLPIKPHLNRRSTMDFMPPIFVTPSPKKLLSQQNKKKTGIVCTRFHKTDVSTFQNIVIRLGKFVVETNVSDRTSHLVVGETSRTINILRAIARGIWILQADWIHDSMKHGKWLPEEEYELLQFSPAVQQCRIERETFGPLYSMDLFQNCGSIFVAKKTNPSCDYLEELIKLCKGNIAKTAADATIMIGEYIDHENIICLKEAWVLDCITFNRYKSVTSYLLKPDIE